MKLLKGIPIVLNVWTALMMTWVLGSILMFGGFYAIEPNMFVIIFEVAVCLVALVFAIRDVFMVKVGKEVEPNG